MLPVAPATDSIASTSGTPAENIVDSVRAKRAMAADQVGLMRALGHERFALVGHDRGGRVAHRLAIDHPRALSKLVVLDICPTLAMYEQTDMAFASAYFHWFLLIQPAPLPERLIGADPEFYLSRHMGGRSAGLAPFAPTAWREYVRAASNPEAVRAMAVTGAKRSIDAPRSRLFTIASSTRADATAR